MQTLPMHQRYTWAQIVKGEHKNNDFLVGTRASFSPLIPTLRCQKSEGKEIFLNMKEQQQTTNRM